MTLRWWNEVWLNEGFATYVSYLGADHAEPTWNVVRIRCYGKTGTQGKQIGTNRVSCFRQKDLIVLEDVHRSFAIDALTSSHPLSSKEDDIVLPEQIMQQFDAISYSKVHPCPPGGSICWNTSVLNDNDLSFTKSPKRKSVILAPRDTDGCWFEPQSDELSLFSRVQPFWGCCRTFSPNQFLFKDWV